MGGGEGAGGEGVSTIIMLNVYNQPFYQFAILVFAENSEQSNNLELQRHDYAEIGPHIVASDDDAATREEITKNEV